MRIIGTAGHVDHGKSTLIASLTGIHPDRLKEEIVREMTIDLGFSSLKLSTGEVVGIIDVPGHIDFIENMLSGIFGIDLVLFVIAVDEGVCAQTREHLAILDTLNIRNGIVVLTKADLIQDAEWLELITTDATSLIEGTSLEGSPIIPVSAKTKKGLDILLAKIEEKLFSIQPRIDYGRPRLAVDRVFTLAGFGTVVTGTMRDGCLAIGDGVTCLPPGLDGRIRGLQNHNNKVEKVYPGQRVAININGIEKDQIKRGNVITKPGLYRTTSLVNAQFRCQKGLRKGIKQNVMTKIFVNASETLAKVRIIGQDSLQPGQEGYIQLKLEHSIVAVKGDRYILRLPSPSETIGGGVILDPTPKKFRDKVLDSTVSHLESIAKGSNSEVFLKTLDSLSIARASDVLEKVSIDLESGLTLINELLEQGEIIKLRGDRDSQNSLLTTFQNWQLITNKIIELTGLFHQKQPLKEGISLMDLRNQFNMPSKYFDYVIEKLTSSKLIKQKGNFIALYDHTIKFNPEQRVVADLLMDRFNQNPYSPPSLIESIESIGQDLLNALIAKGELIQISDQVLFSASAYTQMEKWVHNQLKSTESLTIAQLRDHFQTSRKYAVALLEHLDKIGLTMRKGDYRVLKIVK